MGTACLLKPFPKKPLSREALSREALSSEALSREALSREALRGGQAAAAYAPCRGTARRLCPRVGVLAVPGVGWQTSAGAAGTRERVLFWRSKAGRPCRDCRLSLRAAQPSPRHSTHPGVPRLQAWINGPWERPHLVQRLPLRLPGPAAGQRGGAQRRALRQSSYHRQHLLAQLCGAGEGRRDSETMLGRRLFHTLRDQIPACMVAGRQAPHQHLLAQLRERAAESSQLLRVDQHNRSSL